MRAFAPPQRLTAQRIAALLPDVPPATLYRHLNTLTCLDDLQRRAIVTGGNKQMWAGIIILGGPLGQAPYWLYGRGPY